MQWSFYLPIFSQKGRNIIMNYALIFAGGTGQRMNSKSKPKQFLELHGKPILIHTLEYFEKHEMIDGICVVCLEKWHDELQMLLRRYGISKVKWVTKGGATGHDSIYNGLLVMSRDCKADDVVLIHDGVRPLITEELITENIEAVYKYHTAITVEASAETVVSIGQDGQIRDVPPRAEMNIAKAPQSFFFGDIAEVHELAQRDGYKSIDSCDLMHHYGRSLHSVKSTPYNIKVATPSDFYVFRAIYEARENSQIFGL